MKLPSGDEAALLTRYADVRHVLSDPRFTRQLTADDAARLNETESGGLFNSEMSTAVPDDTDGHLRWRRMITKWFTAKRMAALRPGTEAMAEQLIDEMVERGQPADPQGQPRLPVARVGDLRDARRPRGRPRPFSHWSDAFLDLTRFTEDETKTAYAEFVPT